MRERVFEKKDILPLTIPVVTGYIIYELAIVITGLVSITQVLPVIIMQTAMSSMFIISYLNAKKYDPENQEK